LKTKDIPREKNKRAETRSIRPKKTGKGLPHPQGRKDLERPNPQRKQGPWYLFLEKCDSPERKVTATPNFCREKKKCGTKSFVRKPGQSKSSTVKSKKNRKTAEASLRL